MRRLIFVTIAAIGFATAAQAQVVNCRVYSAQPSSTAFAVGTTPALPCDRSGAPWVNPIGGGGTSSTFGSAFPSTGTAAGFTDGTNMQPAKVDANKYIDVDIQTFTASLPAGTAIIGKVGIDQTTPGTTNGVVINAAVPAGANIIGKVGIDQTTPGTTNGVQVNAALPAGTNLIGKTGIDQTTPGTTNGVSTVAATSGGTSLFTLTLAASTNATNVKASPGQVYSISGFNMSSATPVWISLYNNAGTPTCGTGIIQQFMIPGNTTGSGFVYDFATPKAFATGIAFCATTGIAGTGNPAATTYVLNIDFK